MPSLVTEFIYTIYRHNNSNSLFKIKNLTIYNYMSDSKGCAPQGGVTAEAEFLRGEIARLKKEKNAVIMAHYYQRDEVQEIADRIGDSLALAQMAAETDADIIVMCGVHFMGETAQDTLSGQEGAYL